MDETSMKRKREDEDEEEQSDTSDDDFECNEAHSRYSAGEEMLPKQPAYHANFNSVKNRLRSLLDEFSNIPIQVNSHDPLAILRKEHEILREEMPGPQVFRLAMVGDTGKGKSSLVNSVLDVVDLAETGASGNSVTNVVLEYGAAFSRQEKAFAAQVSYVSRDRIQQSLYKHINDYRVFQFPELRRDDDWNQDDHDHHELLARSALTTFLALFCDTADFKSPCTSKQYLLDTKSQPVEQVVSCFLYWCDAILERHRDARGLSCISADTARELANNLAQFTSGRPSNSSGMQTPALWPLVDVVRVGLKDSRIVENLVLVDLPGLSDVNQVRVQTSQAYLRKCHAVWVVTDIGRVKNDSSTFKLLTQMLERFGHMDSDNVALICTHSEDNIDESKLIADLKRDGHDTSECELGKQNILRLNKDIKKCRTKIAKSNKSEKATLITQLQELKDAKISNDNRQKVRLVTLRNADVTAALRGEFADRITDKKPLNVFCISNTEYRKLKDAPEENSVDLTAEATGIPALRAYAWRLPAPYLWKALVCYLEGPFAGWIDGLAIWSHGKKVTNRNQLVRRVATRRQSIGPLLDQFFAAAGFSLDTSVLNKLGELQMNLSLPQLIFHATDHGIPHFASKVLQKNLEWNGWHHQTYRAFCNNGGYHKTSTKPRQSWNEQMMEPVKQDYRSDWITFEETEAAGNSACLQKMSVLLMSLPTEMREDREVKLMRGMQHFDSYIQTRVKMLETIFQENLERMQGSSNEWWLNATTEDDCSYIVGAMSEAYQLCAEISGPGSTKKMFGIMSAHLNLQGERSPFAMVNRSIKNAFEMESEIAQAYLHARIRKLFKSVEQNFALMIDRQDKDVPDDPKLCLLRRRILAFEAKARREMKIMQKELYEAKKWSSH